MTTESTKSKDLLDQKDAIKSYLDSLLDTNQKLEKQVSNDISTQVAGHIPQWAKSEFGVLNFCSAGIQLYVPVSFVRGIKNIGGRIDKVKGTSDWIKGSITTKGEKVTVIDTESLVVSSNKRTVDYQHPDANSYVILLGDGNFGLVCDTVGQVKQITAADVHWRVNSSKRRWLAGMLQDEVAALIDARRLALAVSMESTLV